MEPIMQEIGSDERIDISANGDSGYDTDTNGSYVGV